MNTARPWRPVVKQWLWLLGALLAATALLAAYDVFWRANLAIYDAALPTGAAPGDVVIVAADDASIAAQGRWPWPRELHAQLLERLRTAGARAVAFDILFTEPDPQGDAAFAAAMRRGPPVVLPLFVEMSQPGRPPGERLPVPALAEAAADIGHANLELDRDGVGRSVFLREGLGAPDRAHLMLKLLEHAPGIAPPPLRGVRHPDPGGAPADVWVRDYRLLIPFLGAPGHFKRVSYDDVLQGRVGAEALRDQLVLVGATAQGVGDAYPTPRSGHGVAMPGVEIAANVLQALRSGAYIRPMPKSATVLLSMLPILIAALGLLRFSPRQSLILTALMWLSTLGASVLALRWWGWWWPPTAPLAGLLAMYPLWSWRRLEASQAYMDEELARLNGGSFPLLVPASGAAAPRLDVIEQRIHLIRQAVQRSQDVRRLFSDTLNSLPDATLLADATGCIVIANPAAARLFGTAGHDTLEGSAVDAHLHQRSGDEALRFAQLAANAPATVEALLPAGARNLLVRTVPFFDSTQARVGTLIDLTDITALRAAQREREDVLRFLSHDMKSPASSLLGLAQLQRDPQRALPPPELSQRLDLLAQRLLALVDGFVGLARAESADPKVFEEFDLRDAVQDAYDESWAAAQARDIDIAWETPAEAIPIDGDRSLVARAITNLLNNALKFSPGGSVIHASCRVRNAAGVVRIEDQGPGIGEEAQQLLFRRFARRMHRGSSDPGGAGLGLAFVRVVAEKHGGQAWMQNAASGGAVFCIGLPLAMAADPAGAADA